MTGTGRDVADNRATFTADEINIDKTRPVITVTTPQEYAVLPVGTVLSFGTADALSGLDGGGSDKFRIKIRDRANGLIIYDNQLEDTVDTVDPVTALGGGNIIVHGNWAPKLFREERRGGAGPPLVVVA